MSSPSGGTQVFTPLHDEKETQRVFHDLVAGHREILIKGPAPKAEVVKVLAHSFQKTLVQCETPSGWPLAKEEDVVVQFNQGDDKYIAQAKARRSGDRVTLELTSTLYRIQRREDFRLRIPSSFAGSFRARGPGRQTHDFHLVDLAAGGCRIQTPKSFVLKTGDVIAGTLHFQDRDDLAVEAEVRHVAPHPELPDHALVGMQFIRQSELVHNRMAALVMDLYRELFTRRGPK